MSVVRRSRWAGLALLTLALVTVSCGGSDKPAAAPSTTPTPSSTTAPPPPPAPRVGSCHALDFRAATQPVDESRPVSCSKPHTSVTFAVGDLDLVRAGHLLAVDAATIRAEVARDCRYRLVGYVGSANPLRLSRLKPVWFTPTLEQADAGAGWYRCDVVALRSEGRLLELPRTMKGVLDQPDALDRFGICGTSAPDRRSFERLACAEPHSWRAIRTIGVPEDARYLSKSVGAAASARCRAVAADRAGSSLRFSWSFEWPAKAQWQAGQRFGYCWVPES